MLLLLVLYCLYSAAVVSHRLTLGSYHKYIKQVNKSSINSCGMFSITFFTNRPVRINDDCLCVKLDIRFQRSLYIWTDKYQTSCTGYVPVATILVLLLNSIQQSALSDSVTRVLCVYFGDWCGLALPTGDRCLRLRLSSLALCSKSRAIARLWTILLPVSRPIHSFHLSGWSSFLASTDCAAILP